MRTEQVFGALTQVEETVVGRDGNRHWLRHTEEIRHLNRVRLTVSTETKTNGKQTKQTSSLNS